MMEKATVKEIIAVEKEIHHKIEAERQKWAAWLAEEKKLSERRYEEEREALERACEEERCKAESEAEIRASATVGEAEKECKRLRRITDAMLEKIVRKYLISLITGGQNDSPDVQN